MGIPFPSIVQWLAGVSFWLFHGFVGCSFFVLLRLCAWLGVSCMAPLFFFGEFRASSLNYLKKKTIAVIIFSFGKTLKRKKGAKNRAQHILLLPKDTKIQHHIYINTKPEKRPQIKKRFDPWRKRSPRSKLDYLPIATNITPPFWLTYQI